MKHTNAWRRVHLRDVAEVRTGLAKNSRTVGDLVDRPYLRVANVQDGHVDLTTVKTIAVERSEASRYELRDGDVLMTEGGDFDKLGRGTVWRGEIPGCLHQNHVFAVRPDESQVLPEFLSAWTASTVGRRYFAGSSKQTTNLASINSSQVKAAQIALPPLPEQRTIVRALAAIESQRARVTALVQARRNLKRGLMQQLLTGQRRLLGFRDRWSLCRLGELFAERIELNRGDLPLLSITAERGVVRRETLDRRDTSNPDKSKYLRIAPGDIGYNTMRMWQGVSAISRLEGIVSPAYTICVPNDRIDGRFAATLFKHDQIIHLFRRYSQGLVDDTLSLKFHEFAQITVRIPDIAEQRAIAAVFAAVDNELAIVIQLKKALERKGSAVLDKLLSGEIPIPTS